jgi:RNA polymerase sigma-70 factor (ECF subfamily)
MLLKRLRRKATTGATVEICAGDELLYLEQDTLTLEQRVTRYFEQWRDPVLRYLVAVFGRPTEAEEVTQEAFLQLYRSLHGGKVINNVSAWVFRVAHNLAVNRIRGQQFVDLLDEKSWEELRQSLEDAGPTPEQSLLQRERLERLRVSISRLTLPERECLHLRTKGLRYREIGMVLDLSTTTVAETLYRVIDKLAKETNG